MTAHRPTIDDVARIAGVSRTATSRVINGRDGVRPEVRRHVEEVIAELGFRPDQTARALATGHTSAVELIIIDADPDAFGGNPYYGRVVVGAMRVLGDMPLTIRLSSSPKAAYLMARRRSRPIGRLLVNVPATVAAELRQDGTPVVSLGRSAPAVPFVSSDNADGAQQAVRHLAAGGRRAIAAVLGPPASPCARSRKDGYVDAMRDAGQAPVWVDGDFTRRTAHAAAARLLHERPDVDAIFAACDLTALGVLQALTEAGRRVPDDVAVVGFDDSALAVSSNPPLTSVRQQVEHIAEMAASAVLRELSMAETVPTSLVIRRSSTR